MNFYLVISDPTEEPSAMAELKFFEWLKHLKKTARITEYWALKDKPGLAAIARLNFASDLDELLEGWRQRAPSDFVVEPLKDPQALEAELAKKLLG